MRQKILSVHVERVEQELKAQLDRRFIKHGEKAYASNHEALGIITEEFAELIDAVRLNDQAHIRAELFDVAVAALVAIQSMDARNAGLN